jgi:hypothetical protein
MANPKVKFKRSSVVGKIPGVSDLPLGEIAINTNDGIVYTAKSTDGGLTTSIVNLSGIQIQDEGSLVGYANTLNFVGSGITVVSVSGGVGIVSVTSVTGGGSSDSNSQWVSTSAGIHTLSNVGIGTTNPTSKLWVGGDGYFTGVVTATTFSGAVTYATSSGIATYATTAGISTSVIGGIGSITQLQVTGVSTFANGAVFIGAATSTGTASQILQVTGGAYVSGDVGIGTTNPTTKLDVVGNAKVSGVVSASQFSAGPYSVTSGILTTSSTSQVALVSYSLTSYRSAKLNIQVSYGSTHKITEILVIHNGTETFFTEYGTVSTIEAEFESSSGPTNLASFDSDINSGNFRILVTPGFSGITTFKYISNLITV